MTDTCAIVGKVFAFLAHPGGKERLTAFLDSQETILTIDEVADLTRWSVDHIRRLCSQQRLPYIPGKPHTFIYSDLIRALRQMQNGGDFGRRKSSRRQKHHDVSVPRPRLSDQHSG